MAKNVKLFLDKRLTPPSKLSVIKMGDMHFQEFSPSDQTLPSLQVIKCKKYGWIGLDFIGASLTTPLRHQGACQPLNQKRPGQNAVFVSPYGDGGINNQSQKAEDARLAKRKYIAAQLAKEVKRLGKTTRTDEDNKAKYYEELGKYQLKIHSHKNRGLYLSQEKRRRRALRSAYADEVCP